MKTTSSSRRRGRVLLCFGTALILAAAAPAAPAFADPPEFGSVPDDGARPQGDPGTAGGDPVPSSGSSPISGPGVSRGPYANRIAEQAKALAELGEATTAAEQDLNDRTAQATAAYDHWLELSEEATEMASLAADMAAENYEDSAAEIKGVTDEFDALFEVKPDLLEYNSSDVTAEADSAAAAADVAKASLDAAQAAESIAKNSHTDLADKLDKDTKALEDLIADNLEAIELEDKKAEADNRSNYELGDIGRNINGLRAADAAQRAVEFAVGEAGKPYEWGAEGPDTYDCSGLTQVAYGNQNVDLPRVANDQFRATSDNAVDVGNMLPGDLIFYGDRPGDWTSVYHVGMYIGDGKMVHAPRPGDVVKVSTVWFSDFFGAHRVVEAVPTDSGDDSDTTQRRSQPEPSTEPENGPNPDTADTPTSGRADEPTPQPTPTLTPTG